MFYQERIMGEKRSKRFGQLLKAGLNRICSIEDKTATVGDEEVGALVGLVGTSLQRYRSGAIPTNHTITRGFAEACVSRGMMGKRWLEQFLQAAQFPYYEEQALLARLFPTAPGAARAATAQPNIPPPTYTSFIMRRVAYDAIHYP
jgi:hypothetical protein